MMSRLSVLFLLCATSAGAQIVAAGAPVAEWRLGEGRGTAVEDSSGGGNNGRSHAVEWVGLPVGHALRLDGFRSYVDCGVGDALDITGAVSLAAWVHPLAIPSAEVGVVGKSYESYLLTHYSDGNYWWYIGSGTNHCKAASDVGDWQHVVGTFDGETMRLYVNGRVASQHRSTFARPGRGRSFLIGKASHNVPPGAPVPTDVPGFRGMVGAVRVYGRALSAEEVRTQFRSEAAGYGVDTSWFERLVITLYPYGDHNEIVAELLYRGLLPLSDGATIDVRVLGGATSATAVRWQHTLEDLPATGECEATVSTGGLEPGTYTIRAELRDGGRPATIEKETFAFPAPPVALPSPSDRTAPRLTPVDPPPELRLSLGDDGLMSLRAGTHRYDIRSSFSYPNGGANGMGLQTERGPDAQPETSWQIVRERIGEGEHRVTGTGSFYTVSRRVLLQGDHIRIHDEFTNTGGTDVGILVEHAVDVPPDEIGSYYVGGRNQTGRQKELAGPSVFAAGKGTGLALVPLDDVFIVQAVCEALPGKIAIGTETFALGAGESYTLEWAVYSNGTGDYYDFVNAFRRNEGRVGTIDGGFSFFTKAPFDRRNIPSPEYISRRNIKYGCIHCLSGAADDPGLSIEGIEFRDFPKEMALLTEQVTETKRLNPGFRVMFHVAHSLYATKTPDIFPDSKVIRADGTQAVWEAGRYFSKERTEEGWRWYIYYPTPGNSFHEALMRSADLMMDDIGTDGVFMDGFMWGYRGRWTYDRWDGHSAEIDLKTKTITRKMASVLLLSQPSLIQFCRKIRDKGGVVVANNSVLTRSIARETYLIHDKEVHSGPYLHLAPTCSALTDPSKINSEKDIYLDVLDKLKWGLLFFYYQEGEITHRSLPAYQFPMTFTDIRSGTVRGPERIVTMRAGSHGWAGDTSLHLVRSFDARGGQASHEYVTTVDTDGARTFLDLGADRSAVVERIPLTVTASTPVNCLVRQYDEARIRVLFHGKGELRLHIGTGEFVVRSGGLYRVRGADPQRVVADRTGKLTVPLVLDGQTEVVIEPQAAP